MKEEVSSKQREGGAESQPPAAKLQVEAPLNPEDQEHEEDK